MTATRTALATTAAIAVVLLVSSCGSTRSVEYGANTTSPVGSTTVMAATASPPEILGIQRPDDAATIQVCIDVGPDATAHGPDRATQVLDALASHLERFDLTEPEVSRGLIVEVWTTPSDAESGGLVLAEQVPDVWVVDVPAGLSPQERNARLAEQREQRVRQVAVREAQADLVEELRTVGIEPTASSDLMRCISRANAQMPGRAEQRRVLIVASSLPLEAANSTVRGSLARTRQVIVLGWGPEFVARETAWRPTWESIGAQALTVYEVDDGLGNALFEAIRGALR